MADLTELIDTVAFHLEQLVEPPTEEEKVWQKSRDR